MAIAAGTQIGSYGILGLLGSGGMGEVYRARDTKLEREVAIKVLPPAFARDSERLARFRREAHLLASLNHPNIAAIYGFEETNGTHYLVLELVSGETLADRVKREGPLPVEEALDICKQIAEALEAAHEKNIIHRDLKPANVKVTPEGKVKVLDFGLAKAYVDEPASGDPGDSPTLSAMPTQPGTILGTAAYMSPEQARGKKVDKRTDIWAFGCVLYELLTDKRAFEGENVSEILASVLKGEPDWNALPAETPANIRLLLRRCLQKDRNQRLHDAADVRIEIGETLSGAAVAGPTTVGMVRTRTARRWALLAGLACLIVGAIIASLVVWNRKPVAPPGASAVARLTVTLLPGDQLGSLNVPPVVFSPDGTQLVYVGSRGGTSQLYVRALDSVESKPLPDTVGATAPFFSPDGQWIGFFAQGKLRKVSATGGSSQTLCDASFPAGGSWAPDGTIFFPLSNISGLWKVSASGGKPQEVTKLDRSNGEVSHRWPQILPGGKAVLFTVWTGPGWEEKQIQLHLLGTGERRVLVQGGSTGRYVPTGHVVYSHDGTLMAVPFDLARLEIGGNPPVPLGEEVVEGSEGAHFASSGIGSLAYVAESPRRNERRLVWVDRKGSVEPLPAPPRAYQLPHFSPDGRRIAINSREGTIGIWIYDLSRTTLTRLTSEGSSQAPVWTPDGKRIVYRGTRTGFRNLFWRATDGTGAEERLTTGESLQTPGSWSPDGKLLAFGDITAATGGDIWVLPLEGDRKPQPFLRTPRNEDGPTFSPDGRWLAYVSNESGRNEVYVQPFPGPGGKSQISTEGGSEPLWARNGREMFYRNGDKMMAVDIATQPTFTAGSPQLLFQGRYESGIARIPGYDVSPDGQHFLMIQNVEPEQPATQINVVLNWFEELKRKVPVGK